LTLVHLPTHASWLNQIEIYFSIIQRKVLTPNDFDDLGLLARTLNEFEHRWNEIAEPFEWNFTRDKLAELMQRLAAREPELRLAARGAGSHPTLTPPQGGQRRLRAMRGPSAAELMTRATKM